MWAATKEVGCARVDSCAGAGNLPPGWARALYVCKYQPEGNIQSVEEYNANVHPLNQVDSSGKAVAG